MNQDDLKLYEIFINEEHHFLSEHQLRFSFYAKLMSSIALLTLYGLYRLESLAGHLLLLLGPISVIVISYQARDGCFRFYQRFIEAVSMRAKLEYKLGLMDKKSKKGPWYEIDEIVPPRQMESRIETRDHKIIDSTKEWIDLCKKGGYHKSVLNILTLSTILGGLLLAYCILLCINDIWSLPFLEWIRFF